MYSGDIKIERKYFFTGKPRISSDGLRGSKKMYFNTEVKILRVIMNRKYPILTDLGWVQAKDIRVSIKTSVDIYDKERD